MTRRDADEAGTLFSDLALRTVARLRLNGNPHAGGRVVLVTSARTGEGKTFVACGLATHCAAHGKNRVLLVDANFDHPMLGKLYGCPDASGFAEVLLAGGRRDVPLYPGAVPGLEILHAGKSARRGLLFNPEAVSSFLSTASRTFPLTVVDGPILRGGGVNLAAGVDGVVMVVDSSRTRREVVAGTLTDLGAPRERLLGVVLNKRVRHIPRLLYRFL